MNRNVIQLMKRFFGGEPVPLNELAQLQPLLKEHAEHVKVQISEDAAKEPSVPSPMPRRAPTIVRKRKAVHKVLAPLNGREPSDEMRLFTLKNLSRSRKSKTRREVQDSWDKSHRPKGDKQWSSVFTSLKGQGALRNNDVRTSKCKWRITAAWQADVGGDEGRAESRYWLNCYDFFSEEKGTRVVFLFFSY